MSVLIVVVVGSFCALGFAVALAFRKIAYPKISCPLTSEWIQELSIDRYRPMLRLLDARDSNSAQHELGFGHDRQLEFRRERGRIFREYLKRLNSDFACLCLALKIMMLQSEVDRPDLASRMLYGQIRFAVLIVSAHLRLALYQCNLGSGTVDVRRMLALFDSMHYQLRQMVPESAVWGS